VLKFISLRANLNLGGLQMRWRNFIAGLGGAAAAWPLAARAQQRALLVIGFLSSGLPFVLSRAFRRGLRELGFIEGENVAFEYRWAEERDDLLPALAAELVQRRVAAIVALPPLPSARAAKAATTAIPVVFMTAADPVSGGLVASLNRPGGNLTGVTQQPAPDLTAKRLGLLHKLVPQTAAVAVLLDDRLTGQHDLVLQVAETAGREVGVRIIGVWVGGEEEFDDAFATARRQGAGALIVSPSTRFTNYRYRLVALAAKHRLPAMYSAPYFVTAGGLVSYGAELGEADHLLGIYTGRVLKGEKPADLPVVLPTKFEFVINLKTAKALGLTIPPNLLARADEVIE
jgi:putative tryptophan/tyrosine transport system substrate-binding protein